MSTLTCLTIGLVSDGRVRRGRRWPRSGPTDRQDSRRPTLNRYRRSLRARRPAGTELAGLACPVISDRCPTAGSGVIDEVMARAGLLRA